MLTLLKINQTIGEIWLFNGLQDCGHPPSSKVRTDSRTEFGSNLIFIDWIRIKLAAGSNPILIVQIRTALDHAIDFNERITALTTMYTE